VEELEDSIAGRKFAKLEGKQVPHFSTLNRWIGKIPPETVSQINQIICESLKAHPASAGRKKEERLRVECTSVETNIAPPSDSRLLSKKES
ncbi:MAG: transposase, partial [Planctomycetota bacterium]